VCNLSYEEFKEHIKKCAEEFKKVDKKEVIRLVSHLDADGISASSIMIKLLNKDNRKYSVSIVKQLTKDVINGLRAEPYNCFIFTDLGSGQINEVRKSLSGKKLFILDHHQPESFPDDVVHVNPHLFGFDGSMEISGAGVVYLFAKAIDSEIEKMAHIAIVGAIGDVQEEHGFMQLNNEILESAIRLGKMKIIKGLRLFGAQTRALHKVLEYSTNPYIPGVSGSESGAIQFLNQIGINPKEGNNWRKIVNLTDDELQKLATGIIMKRLKEEKPEEFIGNVYILPDEEKESPLRDAKEFATLLNACGRLDKASLGIGACLGDEKTKQRAMKSLTDYKKEIVKAIKWYEGNQDSEDVVKGDGFVIINAKDNIMATIAGTLASIISKSNGLKDGTFILSMADLLDGNSKVSLRICGLKQQDIDLRGVIKDICDKVGDCEAGGHVNAAGAMIPTSKENKFIQAAKEVLSKKAMEEKVV